MGGRGWWLRDQPESEWFVEDQGKVLNLKFPIYQNNDTLKAGEGKKTYSPLQTGVVTGGLHWAGWGGGGDARCPLRSVSNRTPFAVHPASSQDVDPEQILFSV